MNKDKFIVYKDFFNSLFTDKNYISNQVAAKHAAGQIVQHNIEKVHRKNLGVAASGIVKLLEASNVKRPGFTDWDGNKTDENQVIMFDRIAFAYGTDAASGKEGELAYSTALPAILLNANLIINQSGREILRRPVRSLNANVAGATSLDDLYVDLGEIKYIADNTSTDIYLEFPEGSSLADAGKYLYVMVALNGFATREKA